MFCLLSFVVVKRFCELAVELGDYLLVLCGCYSRV